MSITIITTSAGAAVTIAVPEKTAALYTSLNISIRGNGISDETNPMIVFGGNHTANARLMCCNHAVSQQDCCYKLPESVWDILPHELHETSNAGGPNYVTRPQFVAIAVQVYGTLAGDMVAYSSASFKDDQGDIAIVKACTPGILFGYNSGKSRAEINIAPQ